MTDKNTIQILLDRVATAIAPYHTLLLAYSGGLDSTVLLDILTLLREQCIAHNKSNVPNLTIRAMHVHHGLHQQADYWVTHCRRECQQRKVTFYFVPITELDNNQNIEAAARLARYQTLVSTLRKNEILLTAQHQNDQVETILLAMKRGSGPSGLAAMARDAPFHGHRLVRPLLDCQRSLLEKYAWERQLNWINDDSNQNLRFDRNFLRLHIIPSLIKRWPQFITTAARSAQICAEQETLLDELLADHLSSLINADGSLRITTMSKIKQAAILRRWLAGYGLQMPSRKQLTGIWQEVALSRRDAVAQFKLGNWQIRRFRNSLYILPLRPVLTPNQQVINWPLTTTYLLLPARLGRLERQIISGQVKLNYNINHMISHSYNKNITQSQNTFTVLPHTNHPALNVISQFNQLKIKTQYNYCSLDHSLTMVRAPMPHELVSVRFGSVNGLLYMSGRTHGRSLKKIWQELNIPPWQRQINPLLFYNDTLIAALGVFITRQGEVGNHHTSWSVQWQMMESNPDKNTTI